MIKEIQVRGYKSLASETKVKLGRVNVFVGANGAGKSNLLEALGIIGAAASGLVNDETLLSRGVRPGLPMLYKSSFPNMRFQDIRICAYTENNDATYEASLHNPINKPEPDWSFLAESLREKNNRIIGRSPHSKKTEIDVYSSKVALSITPEFENEHKAAATLVKSLRNYAIFSPMTPMLRGICQDISPQKPVGLSGGNLPSAVADLLGKKMFFDYFMSAEFDFKEEVLSLIDWASGISVKPSAFAPISKTVAAAQKVIEFQDRFMATSRKSLTGYDASEGALFILFAAVLAMHRSAPMIFAVDNFDSCLNPRLLRSLVQRFSEWVLESSPDRQVLMTGHNPSMLDGLDLRNDAIRLFTVNRANSGETVINRIEVSERLQLKLDSGNKSLSQLWTSGEIGGMPNV